MHRHRRAQALLSRRVGGRRWLPAFTVLVTLAVVLSVVSASPGSAVALPGLASGVATAAGPRVVITGSGDAQSAEVHAFSLQVEMGPTGESPTGQVSIDFGSGMRVSGTVTCASTRQNFAVLGVRPDARAVPQPDANPPNFAGWFVGVVDNGNPGDVGPDDITLAQTTSLPTTCTEPYTALTGLVPIGSGDISITAVPTVSTTRFVDKAWKDFAFSGFPSVAQEQFLGAGLDAGGSRRTLVAQLASSPQWLGWIVDNLYIFTLNRGADLAGRQYWIGEIQAGRQTVATTAANFYASSEYFGGFGGGRLSTWVQDLYQRLLHRTADDGGLAFWIGEAQANGRLSVTARFYESPESRHARVDALYLYFLGRPSDPGSADYWAARILNEGDLVVTTELAASPEYYTLTHTFRCCLFPYIMPAS